MKKGIRILIYSDHFLPSIGGSENYALDLATELSREGYKIAVVTAEKSNKRDEFQFKVFRLKKPFSIRRANINLIEVINVIKVYKPDIFHINYQTGGENIIMPLLKLMKIPIIITYHADHVVLMGKLIDELQMAITFRLASLIIVQSERDSLKFRNRGYPENKLKLLRFNGIDTNRYKCNGKSKMGLEQIKLLCIARLDDVHKYKGVGELIDSLIDIRKKNGVSNFKLNIIGDGELRKLYETKCKNNNIENIIFLGTLENEEIIDYLCKSDFLILPSNSHAEGFGRVVLEAISCGTPVIVSKFAGISELVEKYNAGIIYDPNNFNFLMDRLFNIIHNTHKIEEFISNGKKLILEENLSLQYTTKRIVELYNQILKN